MSDVFAGFVPPTQNYFFMPNEWPNITAEIDSLAELKVVEYVLRHTWGFHEFGICKTISIDEFMHGRKRKDGERMDKGTGLSRPSVIEGTKRAICDGYLICTVDDSDQARVKKAYALNMRGDTIPGPCDVKDLNASSKDSLPPGQSRIFTPAVKQIDPSSKESLPRSEKETLERHLEKERETAPKQRDTQKPDSLSLSPVKIISLSPDPTLVEKLTDEQANFWTRWCAIAGVSPLNENTCKHIVDLSARVTSTQDLQSLYDFTYDQLKELAQAKGVGVIPPRLGNLKNKLPEWEQSCKRQSQEQAESEKAHEHLPGTGRLSNWTDARLRGEAPPLRYDPLPQKKQERSWSRLDFRGIVRRGSPGGN